MYYYTVYFMGGLLLRVGGFTLLLWRTPLVYNPRDFKYLTLDTLWFVKEGGPMEGLTKKYDTSPKS